MLRDEGSSEAVAVWMLWTFVSAFVGADLGGRSASIYI